MQKKCANHGKAWTEEHINQLEKLASGNTPTGIIALKLGRSESSIQSQAAKANISLKPTNQSPYDRNVSNTKKRGK